jgi:N-glycosidase YbiA
MLMKNIVYNRDVLLDTSGTIVGLYEREFYPFSNFSSYMVEWRGHLWPTSEHAYQAAHFFDTAPEPVDVIKLSRSAHDAYKIAKSNAGRAPANWHDIKADIMYDICKAKLLQHPYVMDRLKSSGNLLIVEDSPKDSFWGWGPDRKGRNELGKVWMRLRAEMQSGKL